MGRVGDAFGEALADWARGGTDVEVYEREDGFVDAGAGPELFMAPFRSWPAAERKAMRHVRGRVVDVGCGAGRAALHLQERGIDVVGLDSSALALAVARGRGLRETWRMPVGSLAGRIASFDTVVLFGNNFGIFGTPERLRRTLRAWARSMKPGSRILAESVHPASGGAPALDRAYVDRNRDQGLAPGQIRLRIRYHDLRTPYFRWLFVGRAEMRALVRGTGWRVAALLGEGAADPYVGVLERS